MEYGMRQKKSFHNIMKGMFSIMTLFKAKWITHIDFHNLEPICVFHKDIDKKEIDHEEEYKNKHILFRKKVVLDDFDNVVVRISADDYYKLYINGRFVTQGPAPGYNFNYYYNEIDVSDFLVKGENTIAVHTYYQGLVNRVWVSCDKRHGLVFDMYADDKLVCESDESWKCTYHTGYTECGKFGYDTQYAECYYAGAPECGFENVDYNDSSWENAVYKVNPDYTLVPQPTKQLDIYDVKAPVIQKNDEGYFVDFGFEAVGYIKFRASGKDGDTIIMRYGEELNDDGTVRWKMRCCCNYEERFVLSGKGYDTLYQYDYKAFRYAQLIIPEGAMIDEDSIVFTVRHYPFVEVKHYTGDNETLAKIYKLCSDTIKYGVQEVFMDCAHREKGQYLGDVTISGLAHMMLSGDASMIIKALDNYCQSSFICKGLMTVAPSSFMQEIADYSLQFPFQVLTVYNYTKDIDFLKRMYPFVMNVYEYFKTYRRSNGLIESVKDKWNLVDWPMDLRDGYEFELPTIIGEGFHNVINGFYLAMLKHIDEIRAILGEDPLGVTEETEKGYIDMFLDKNQGLFVDSEGSRHASYQSNVLALFADVNVDEAVKSKMIKHIENKTLCSGGTYMSFFALYSLKREGEMQLVEKLICDENAWLAMIAKGATTCFEVWNVEQKWNASLFHPWSSCPAIILD